VVREDHRVGAQQTKQLADSDNSAGAMRVAPPMLGMSKERDAPRIPAPTLGRSPTRHHRRAASRVDPCVARDGPPARACDRGRPTGLSYVARSVVRYADACLACCLGAGRDTVGETRIGLVGQAVIVLDEIQAARARSVRALSSASQCGREPLRLEARSTSTPACARAHHAGGARRFRALGPPKHRASSAGISDVMEHDVIVQRRVPEQHVQELARRRRRSFAAARPMRTSNRFFSRCSTHPPDRRCPTGSIDRRLPQAHFDALFDCDGLCSGVDRGVVATDAVNGGQARASSRRQGCGGSTPHPALSPQAGRGGRKPSLRRRGQGLLLIAPSLLAYFPRALFRNSPYPRARAPSPSGSQASAMRRAGAEQALRCRRIGQGQLQRPGILQRHG